MRKVEVKDYDKSYITKFKAKSKYIEEILGDNLVEIYVLEVLL